MQDICEFVKRITGHNPSKIEQSILTQVVNTHDEKLVLPMPPRVGESDARLNASIIRRLFNLNHT